MWSFINFCDACIHSSPTLNAHLARSSVGQISLPIIMLWGSRERDAKLEFTEWGKTGATLRNVNSVTSQYLPSFHPVSSQFQHSSSDPWYLESILYLAKWAPKWVARLCTYGSRSRPIKAPLSLDEYCIFCVWQRFQLLKCWPSQKFQSGWKWTKRGKIVSGSNFLLCLQFLVWEISFAQLRSFEKGHTQRFMWKT